MIALAFYFTFIFTILILISFFFSIKSLIILIIGKDDTVDKDGLNFIKWSAITLVLTIVFSGLIVPLSSILEAQ